MKIKINDKRVLLYYIVNIFLVLNMMLLLLSSTTILQVGDVPTKGVYNLFFTILFFTAITKGIIAIVLRLPKKEQIILLFMSLGLGIFIAVMSVFTSILTPQIIIQATLLFWSVYSILYNYVVLKNIKKYIPLVVLTSIYAFFTLMLFIILFSDIYKVFFNSTEMLSGILSIIIVFVILEMLQQLAYILIPEYYSDSTEIVDIFDEIEFKYEIRQRNFNEIEEAKNKKILERKMREKQLQAEKELRKQERLNKRRKIKSDVKPLSKNRLNKHLENINKNKD